MDVARLGLAVDSSQVEKGTVSLHQLTGAAGQASAAARQLAGASQVEAVGQKAATVAVQAHNAALMAQNTVMRSSIQQRTMMVYQLNDVAVSLASGMNPAMVAMQQGSQILQGGFMPAVRTLSDLVGGLVTKFWPLAAVVGAVSLAIGGLTHEINKTADVQVGFFDVALAGWQLFAEGVAALVAPVFGAIGSWLQAGWDATVPILKSIGNGIVGTFSFAVKAIGTLWQGLPAALGDVMITTANVIVKGVEYSINKAAELLDSFIGKANEGLALMPGGLSIPSVGRVDFGGAANPYAGALGDLGSNLGGNASDAFGTDYMGAAFGAISGRAQELARARKEMEDLGGATKAANDNVKLLDQGLGDLTHWTESFGKAAQSAFSNLGTGIVEAFRKGGDVASNVLSMLMDKVGQFGETLLNNGLNGLLNAGLGALGGMFGGGTWGVAGGFGGRGIFGIPGMADGGTVGRAGLSWVGEQGPELLRLPQGAQVIPNAPSMAMAANQNSGDFIINNVINVPPGTTADVAPAIAREVTKELRKQLPDAIQSYNRNPLRRAG